MTTILFRGKKYPVSFFRDDTIETVQQQISRSIDIHPDKLFILVGLKLSQNYYTRDPRNWERLFERLSLDGTSIKKETFEAYCSDLRYPPIKEPFQKMDREEWMQSSGIIKDPIKDFMEYRILGVEPTKSYCLPLDISDVASQIPAAQYPIPQLQSLFVSFYGDLDITGFLVLEGEKESPYFPLLRTASPDTLTEAQIKSLEANTAHLKDLLALDVPKPKSTIILKANWKIDLVDTDLGDAVRTRFEQIFYGLTVSPEVPCITFWTSSTEISRHKFYREPGQQKPLLDIPMWKFWLTKSKPAREKVVTLILYRGTSRENYDRISISPYDIIFAAYRDSTNEDGLHTLQKKLLSWFGTFDAVIPFIKPSDYILCRLELQEVKYEAFYSQGIQKFDTSRMNCLTGIFEESTKNKSLFRFLRSDHTKDDLNPRDLKIINMLKENRGVTPQQVEKELKVSLHDAINLLNAMNSRIEEDPDLLTREHSRFPKVEIREKSIVVAYVNEVDRYLTYTNILRYILSNPESKDLDRICPKKLEVSDTSFSIGSAIDIEYSDLFDFLEKEPELKKEVQEIKTSSGYSYFNNRLKEKKINLVQNYPKDCEKPHQPIILTDEDLAAISGTPYDPEKYEEKFKLRLDDPPGLFVCPEYWCMTDEIPLQERQLQEIKGSLSCPVCHGKVREMNDTKLDVIEYSVLKRKVGYSFPKFKDNQKNIPCCYKTEKTQKLAQDEEQGKYYILNPDKMVGSLRLAYVQKSILKSLFINETYQLAKTSVNRIQSGMSGFFRVGISRPSLDLPKLLRLQKEIVSPRFSIPCLLRCAFLSTWSKVSEKYAEEIEKELTMKPFTDTQTRKKMARIISSISEEFDAGTLNESFELEYSAIVLKTDLFKINLDTETFSCSFFTPQTINKARGLIILQLGNQLDCLSHVMRSGKKMRFSANVFEEPFDEKTHKELFYLRAQACNVSMPTFNSISYYVVKKKIENYKIIIDPFGRAQAFYLPGKFILPFQSVPLRPVKQEIIEYHEVKELPTYAAMMDILKEAGYTWSEDIYNGDFVTEILTTSGLRIPIKAFKKEGPVSEVFQTVFNEKESELTFGEPSEEDLATYKQISYNAEIHEFLLFQLSRDLDDYPELKKLLIQNPKGKLEHLLYNWFEETTHFMEVKTPIEFLSKIRKPCGQLTKDTCNASHMCAWAGKCKIQIRDTFSKPKVFQKLLRTLIENSKIRSLVIDGRTTPFFSTILYLELPNELIITDREIKQFTQSEP